MVQWFCLISSLFDVLTSLFGIMSQYDLKFDLKINIGHCDLYFIVQWFCVTSWGLFDVWTSYFWDYGSVWHIWPQNKCRSLTYISWSSDFALYLEDYLMFQHHYLGLRVRNPKFWPRNKCRSMWPVFHGPVTLSYISKTVWCMSVIIYFQTVWPKLWYQICQHDLVILLTIFKIIWWMNIIVGIMAQCDT